MSMVLIQRQVLSSSAASVTFSNIPQNYRTLRLVISCRDTSTQDNASFLPNGSSSNLSRRELTGSGSAASSGTGTSILFLTNNSNYTASTFSNVEIMMPNYSGSAFKVISVDEVSENNATLAYQRMTANLWSSTSAITSIQLNAGISFAANSTFTLYGLI